MSEDEFLNIMVGSMAGGRHGTGAVSKSLHLIHKHEVEGELAGNEV